MKAALMDRESTQGTGVGGLPELVILPGLCCQAVGGQRDWTDTVSAAWFLFYLAAHLMDKLEDRDPLEPWLAEQPPGVAANVASGLYFSANAVLNQLYEDPKSRPMSGEIIGDFYQSLLKMASGQHQELAHPNLSLPEYWEVASAKSSTFFSLACRSGARLGGGNEEQVRLLGEFGMELGLIIQILDDLDATTQYTTLSSPAERAQFIHALPVTYAFQFLPEVQHEQLASLLREGIMDEDSANKAMEMIEDAGAGLYMFSELQRHRIRALNALEQAHLNSVPQQSLTTLIEKIAPLPA